MRYTDKNGNPKDEAFSIGQVVIVHTEKRIYNNRTTHSTSVEKAKEEIGTIIKFVNDIKGNCTSFILRKPNLKTKRVFFMASREYTATRLTLLKGTIQDYPEYLL